MYVLECSPNKVALLSLSTCRWDIDTFAPTRLGTLALMIVSAKDGADASEAVKGYNEALQLRPGMAEVG